MSIFATKWVRFAQNGTNPSLFQIRFQYITHFGAKIAMTGDFVVVVKPWIKLLCGALCYQMFCFD